MTDPDERVAGRDYSLIQIARIKAQLLGKETKPVDLYRNDPKRGRDHCTAYDGQANRLLCDDDRCSSATVTLCGLTFGVDFDEDEIQEGP